MPNNVATKIKAEAVNLFDWLSGETTFAVPAYQRNYRWGESDCKSLLESMKTATEPYFIGSILSTTTKGSPERTLVDGQQRLVTLTLLLVALYQSASEQKKTEIGKILFRPDGGTRVRPFKERATLLAKIIKGESVENDTEFCRNFRLFQEDVKQNFAAIWSGFKKLECVDIAIAAPKAAQQIFESLNSTGKPLTDAELINNHILMPFDRDFQEGIEETYWIPIEKQATFKGKLQGGMLDDFFRHYMSLVTGKKVDAKKGDDNRNVFSEFKKYFADKNMGDKGRLTEQCQEWLQLAEAYHLLLNPEKEANEDIREYLVSLNKFGESAYPFLMAVLRDYKKETIDVATLRKILHLLETYYVRRAVCGTSNKDVGNRMAPLYSGLDRSNATRYYDTFAQKIFLGIPSDEDVKQSLLNGCKGHGMDILVRLDGKKTSDIEKIKEEQKESNEAVGIDIEHIFPCNPGPAWNNGDHEFSEDEKIRTSVLLNSIGNWAPLEKHLNIKASNLSFPEKKQFYQESQFDMVKECLFGTKIWDIDAIETRTEILTDKFLRLWHLPSLPGHKDDPELVPILSVPFRAVNGCYTELNFSQAEFQSNPVQASNIKELYTIVIKTLWKNCRDDVLAANERVNQDVRPIHDTNVRPSFEANRANQIPLDSEYYYYAGFWHCYYLQSLCSLLTEMNLADQLFVKYAEAGD